MISVTWGSPERRVGAPPGGSAAHGGRHAACGAVRAGARWVAVSDRGANASGGPAAAGANAGGAGPDSAAQAAAAAAVPAAACAAAALPAAAAAAAAAPQHQQHHSRQPHQRQQHQQLLSPQRLPAPAPGWPAVSPVAGPGTPAVSPEKLEELVAPRLEPAAAARQAVWHELPAELMVPVPSLLAPHPKHTPPTIN